MQRFLIAVLAAVPLPALAQGFVRAAGEFQYQKHDYGADFDVDSVQGYLDTASMLGTFGAQVGVTPGKEIGRWADIDVRQYNAVAVHAITDPSDILSAVERQSSPTTRPTVSRSMPPKRYS